MLLRTPFRFRLSPGLSRVLVVSQALVYSGLLLALSPAQAQTQSQSATASVPIAIDLPRDSVRALFGTYEFEPQFKMRIFSENRHLYAQRLGDNDRFEIFPKSSTGFFLKAVPAELVFRTTGARVYDRLELHQGGTMRSARRIESQPYELYDTILHLDSMMYEAYNQRNLSQFMTFLSPELEFYHDQNGRSNYTQNKERFEANFTKPTRMRRQISPTDIDVYAIPGFGAVQLGTHHFYQTDPGQAERLVASPRFMHVWQNNQGRWTILRIVSYDH